MIIIEEKKKDIDNEKMGEMEDEMENFEGWDVIIRNDRMLIESMEKNIIEFEGERNVEWFEGNLEEYEDEKIRSIGKDRVKKKRVN